MTIRTVLCSTDYKDNNTTETLLSSREEEDHFFAELKNRILSQHEFVWCQTSPPLDQRIRDLFTVIDCQRHHYLGPKVIKEEELGEPVITHLTYENGVIEELWNRPSCYRPDRSGIQRLPDGTIRVGELGHYSLEQGSETKEGRTALCRPRFFHQVRSGEKIMAIAAIISAANQTTLRVATKENGPDPRYFLNEEMTLEDVIFISQNGRSLQLQKLRSDPSFERIVRRLFEPENNDLLLSLDLSELLPLLTTSKQLSIHPCLHKLSSQGDSLLARHFKDLSAEDVALILEIDPAAINPQRGPPFFTQAAIEGKGELALLLLQAAQRIPLALEGIDAWYAKIIQEDLSFTDEAFLALDQPTKQQLYQTCNLLRKKAFVTRLNTLGMKNETLLIDSGSYFGPNMDTTTLDERIQILFLKMRQRGDLFTQAEYDQRYSHGEKIIPYTKVYEKNGFIDKGDCLSRFFGALYFNKKVKEIGAEYTRAVRKIVVVTNPLTTFDVYTYPFVSFGSSRSCLRVKAEYIPNQGNYQPDQKESLDLVKALEKAGYVDLHPGANVRITKQGAFIIDNELVNLRGLGPMEYEKLLTRFPLHEDAKVYVRAKLKEFEAIPTASADQIAKWEESRLQRQNLLLSVGLKTGSPFPVDLSSILEKAAGFRTKPMTITTTIKDGSLEILGEGPGMSWESGIAAYAVNATTWKVSMPEGNYSYRLALRHPDGTLSLESFAGNRDYRFFKNQEPITAVFHS